MPDKLLCKCSLIKGSSSHATLGRDVTSANSYLWHSFWRFGYHPCGFQIAHAEQVTDLPPVFLHIAWELILAWGREDDSLQEGCWEQTTEKGVKKEMRKEEVKNSNSGWKALANETKSEYNVRNAFFPLLNPLVSAWQCFLTSLYADGVPAMYYIREICREQCRDKLSFYQPFRVPLQCHCHLFN